jgi:hypothetical protein
MGGLALLGTSTVDEAEILTRGDEEGVGVLKGKNPPCACRLLS